MKTKMKHFLVLVCFFGATFQLFSQGYIVPNGVTLFPPASSNSGSEIHVLQSDFANDYTGFNLAPRGRTGTTLYTNTFLFNPFADDGVRTFLVSSNQPISLTPILAGSYPELTYPNNYVFNSGIPFYLGFYTGHATSFPPVTYNDPLFGWGRFVNNQGVIQMLDSALAYKADGIYVGTQNIIQPVPEPGIFGLFALSGLLFGFRRLWKK